MPQISVITHMIVVSLSMWAQNRFVRWELHPTCIL